MLQALPGVDVILAGDSNLWVPGLVQACPQRPADRSCLVSLRLILQTYGLEICNPLDSPTHSRGAALDLVIASPGVVDTVSVHHRACNCSSVGLCCPVLSSDHFAVEIGIHKRLVQTVLTPSTPTVHVRDWAKLIQAQMQDVQRWSSHVQACISDLARQAPTDKRLVLDNLYDDFLEIVWNADPKLYRCSREGTRKQPTWWNDACFDAMLARNAACRRRNCSAESLYAFRAARNRFHRIVRAAKIQYWSSWLHRVEHTQSTCPRAAARMVRRRFRCNACRVAPRLSPDRMTHPSQQSECMHQWRDHFRDAASLHSDAFDVRHFRRINRRVDRIRATRDAQHPLDPSVGDNSSVPFTLAELRSALQHCTLDKAPGCDKIPYRALCVDISWWQHAVLNLLELCRLYGCVPSIWKHGVVVPMAKNISATERNDYRPITLTSCFAKTLERMVLDRIRPAVDLQLDPSQAGFRWGPDVQFYTLWETLRLRKNSRTFCAFLDLRKAFDVAWRDGALLKLYRAGIPIHLWHLVDDLVSDRTAAVRIGSCASDSWDVESGVGQGAVLSGFLFNLLINGLAAAIKRACGGVSCGPDRGAPRLQVLLYADDIVILSDSPADLQRGLDAARDWANAWRFHFSIGPNKSAFVVFGRRRAGTQHVRFHVGEHVLPRVTTYTYLGITLHERLGWTQHVDELLCRGERKLAACVSWTQSATLPLFFVERIFHSYVRPSACFGLEFVPKGAQIRRFQARLIKWGRRLLTWPHGSPRVAVQGQLGWHDADTLRLSHAAGLCARLLCLPPHCFAAQLAQFALNQPLSWVREVLGELSLLGVPPPHAYGIHFGSPATSIKPWLRTVKTLLTRHADRHYASLLQECSSFQQYACWQPRPALHRAVYGPAVATHRARYWGLARCGHHPFADGRAARHRAFSASLFNCPCRFCARSVDSLAHALFDCPAHIVLRKRWASRSRHALSLHVLFSTDGDVNTFRDIRNNIDFVADVCIAAEACEM